MGLQIVRKEGSDSQVYFQKIFEDVPGGGTLKITELKAATKWLNGGAVVKYTESTRVVNLTKTALLYADCAQSVTEYPVYKNHEFLVGDYLASAAGAQACDIIEIDTTTSEDYDILKLSATITLGEALTAADIIVFYESKAQSGAEYKYPANGILKHGVKIDQLNTAATAVSVVTRGTVYERRLPFSVSTAMKTALGDRFLFSQSF